METHNESVKSYRKIKIITVLTHVYAPGNHTDILTVLKSHKSYNVTMV